MDKPHIAHCCHIPSLIHPDLLLFLKYPLCWKMWLIYRTIRIMCPSCGCSESAAGTTTVNVSVTGRLSLWMNITVEWGESPGWRQTPIPSLSWLVMVLPFMCWSFCWVQSQLREPTSAWISNLPQTGVCKGTAVTILRLSFHTRSQVSLCPRGASFFRHFVFIISKMAAVLNMLCFFSLAFCSRFAMTDNVFVITSYPCGWVLAMSRRGCS